MPRPLRIEFENAQYHVMNRGAGKKNIFRNNKQRQFFIELLSEANKLFNIEVHAYCLMSNHYHLLIKTPFPNLSRTMQYINGVYTPYFNRDLNMDGPLFRGRYKAILISYDEYYLNVSRYIHLNPMEAKITNHPLSFRWSSYRYFVTSCQKPSWLNIKSTLDFFPSTNPMEEYRKFIKLGIDPETHHFFNKTYIPTIFASKNFKKSILSTINNKKRRDSSADYNRTSIQYTSNQILQACAEVLNVPENQLLKKINGKVNTPRKIAIYIFRMVSGEKIAGIAEKFSCKSCSNISDIVKDIKTRLKENLQLKTLIDNIYTALYNLPKTSI